MMPAAHPEAELRVTRHDADRKLKILHHIAATLRARSNSMIEEHIADGDFVLIRPQTTARNGDIVVAQVEENAVTLKRFFKEKDKIRLQPANPEYAPQFYDDVRIQGKLIGVIRRLD